MPIANEASRWANTNTPNPHEGRVTATVGTGHEVMLKAADNNVSPAKTFEARIQQAVYLRFNQSYARGRIAGICVRTVM